MTDPGTSRKDSAARDRGDEVSVSPDPEFSAASQRDPAARRIASEVLQLLENSARQEYFGEAVSQLSHALQCAALAVEAGADEELILAALLHDIGHLLETPAARREAQIGVINHDAIGERWLRERGFSPRLAALVGGHVAAKRYLTAVNPQYRDRLSPASRATLALQGGPMEPSAVAEFAAGTALRDLLRLRSWDEQAKDPGWQGPGLEAYREMLIRHLAQERPA